MLRRGFKSESDEIALRVRLELGLDQTAPLDPFDLANHLAIPVIPLSAYNTAIPSAVEHFSRIEPSAFSAITVFNGLYRAIVHNDAHAPVRQNSNLAHELSHTLLDHPPGLALDALGCRAWDEKLEEEAAWLTGALLIPSPAALHIALRGLTLDAAAREPAVSVPMMRYRLNVTGMARRSMAAH